MYKLFLPTTTLPTKASSSETAQALTTKVSAPTPTVPSADFYLHGGPPFANGELHLGHCLNVVLKDATVRFQRALGKTVRFELGWDCHGLPLELKVLKRDPNLAHAPDKLRSACRAEATKYVQLQAAQLKRLGLQFELDHAYLTMSNTYEAAQLRLWAQLQDKGLVYRQLRPVWWSTACQTALAEAELEYQDNAYTDAWFFVALKKLNAQALVWTTQPWTLLGNKALGFNPAHTYAVFNTPEYGRVVANTQFGQAQGWSEFTSLTTEELVSLEFTHPLWDSEHPLLPCDFVEATTGTGFVHLAPGHGMEDYLATRSANLAVVNVLTPAGLTCNVPEAYQGLTTNAATHAVLTKLQTQGALFKSQTQTHRYPFCWRSKTPVITRALPQWFVNLTPVKQPLVAALTTVQMVPPTTRLTQTVLQRQDWCVSRQRVWGLPLPVFYTEDGTPVTSGDLTRKVAELFEQEGSDVWFAWSAAKLCTTLGLPSTLTPGRETMDVWLDSGSSTLAVQKGQVADLYLEGNDQHRGWFQSSAYVNYLAQAQVPYRAVLTHGFVNDETKKKYSKSTGAASLNSYLDAVGPDVLRLWVLSSDYTNDIVFSETQLTAAQEQLRLFRNTGRVLLGNLTHPWQVPRELDRLSQLYLNKLAETQEACAIAVASYQYYKVVHQANRFLRDDFSGVYLESVKDTLYCDAANSYVRNCAAYCLAQTYAFMQRWLTPVVPFCLAELETHAPVLPALPPLPTVRPELSTAYAALNTLRTQVNQATETLRTQKLVGKNSDCLVTVPYALEPTHVLEQYLACSQVVVDPTSDQPRVFMHTGKKCPRCRKNYEHLTQELCPRCHAVEFST